MAAPQFPVTPATQGLPLDLSGRPPGAVHQARPPAPLAPVGIPWCFSISFSVSTFSATLFLLLFLFQAPVQPHCPIHPPWPSVADDESSHHPSSPAESVARSVQGREGDHVDEPMEEALRSSGTARKNKVVLDLHTSLYPHFSELFHRNEVTVDWHQDRPPAEPLLLIDPVLAKTWLRPLPSGSDSHGYWDPQVVNGKLPPNRSRLYPPSTRSKPGSRAPYYHVQDDALREMFKANIPGTVPLDIHVFDIGEISVSSSPLALMEAHSRAALLECYTTDSYLFIINELTKCIVGSSDLMSQVEAMELLPGVVRQSAQANSRTINILRGGDFTGPSLFGPLPESFSALLDAPQGAKYRCSSKSSGKTSTQRTSAPVSAAPAIQKRPISAAPAAKRQKTAPPAATPAKQGYFHNKPAGRGKYKYGRS